MQNNRNSGRNDRDQTPEEKQFDERILAIDRVARVVKGGRRFRFRALAVVGDRKNKIGIGSAKGADVTTAVAKAMEVANQVGMITVGMTGATGGQLKSICQHLINVPSTDTPRIQESHIMLGHIMCELVEKMIFTN